MANTSSHNVGRCIPAIDEKLFDLGCLGPALAVILILASLNRRKQFKLEYCNGYPGLLIPVNFLCSFSRHNRFSIAITFGATASTCLSFFISEFLNQTDNNFNSSPVYKVFQGLIFVLVYGILFYPYFACLTTEHRLIGSILGLFYAAMRSTFKIVIDFQCFTSYKTGVVSFEIVTNIIKQSEDNAKLSAIPTYLCSLFIVVRFAVLVFLEVRKKWFHSASDIDHRVGQPSETSLVGDSGMKHVKQLINPGLNLSVTEVKWFMRPIYFCYKLRTDFKFSTQLISTLVVAAIALFQGFVADQVIIDAFKALPPAVCVKNHSDVCSQNDRDICSLNRKLILILIDSLQAAFILSALISVLMLLHFMRCHRDHVLQLYRGQRTFFQGVFPSTTTLVSTSLQFSGYQIAYTLAGFLFCGVFLTGVFFALGLMFKIFFEKVNGWVIAWLPSTGMALLTWLCNHFLDHFVFRKRDSPGSAITVDNRRLFSIMSYFFFFCNVPLGFFSFLRRILTGTLMGIVLFSRIDRPCTIQGFQTLDKAFVAYLGFVNVLVAHSHPVMLVFCDLLENRNKDRGLEESKANAQSAHVKQRSSKDADSSVVYTRERRLPRLSQKAFNRWHVAVMLLRNPSLVTYRRQCGVAPSVDLGSINADINTLV